MHFTLETNKFTIKSINIHTSAILKPIIVNIDGFELNLCVRAQYKNAKLHV